MSKSFVNEKIIYKCKKCGYESDIEERVKECGEHPVPDFKYNIEDKVQLALNKKIKGTVKKRYVIGHPTLGHMNRYILDAEIDGTVIEDIHVEEGGIIPLEHHKKRMWEP